MVSAAEMSRSLGSSTVSGSALSTARSASLPTERAIDGLSMMGPPERLASRPPRCVVARRQALLGEQFSAPEPSLCHAPPTFLVLGLTGEFGHQLAFSGVLQELFRRVDRDHHSFSFFDAPNPTNRIQRLAFRASGS